MNQGLHPRLLSKVHGWRVIRLLLVQLWTEINTLVYKCRNIDIVFNPHPQFRAIIWPPYQITRVQPFNGSVTILDSFTIEVQLVYEPWWSITYGSMSRWLQKIEYSLWYDIKLELKGSMSALSSMSSLKYVKYIYFQLLYLKCIILDREILRYTLKV